MPPERTSLEEQIGEISASYHLPVRSYESAKMRVVKVVTTTCAFVCARVNISTSVQRNQIKFGLSIAPVSRTLTSSLSVSSSFLWGDVPVLHCTYGYVSRLLHKRI